MGKNIEVIGKPLDSANIVLAVLQYGHFLWTKSMLDSVKSRDWEVQLVLLDQGSPEEDWNKTTEYQKTREDLILLRSQENLGIPKGWNTIIKYSLGLCPYVLVAPNDIVYRPDTIDNLMAAWESKQFENIITASSIWMGEKRNNTLTEFWEGKFKPTRGWTWTGFNGLITKEFIEKVGWYDEDLGPWWWDDTDMLLRIFKSGHLSIAVHDSRVWLTNHSTKQESIDKRELSEIYQRNMRRFAKKHNLDLGKIHQQKQWQYHYAVDKDGRVILKERP